ncbi:MBL fold metallo-hydrolase [Mycolicibacterium agri]|uniref:MBL fold metallo-hydrolase n=1 Tax=Mycolicibacterium agri TaxID=36811 RepID=A0A2A7N5M4_MYCAG|nr:MBL fold metallo-hydrolase [Mycolicibacterium agri]PEG39139.1 MBL fold metallo-hydrolase [Mycolicibacterium agri]GFG53930.1 MBL fold metallo-hydrolase [Mycolicibacterium agri]
MEQILTDLWQTRTDSPFPGLTTHAYLWTGANALFYSVATDSDFAELDRLGGVAAQYLSHRDEAGPMLAKIAAHFHSSLHAPAAELAEIGKHSHIDVALGSRHVDVNGIEIIPTPGHSPGSTCYLVNGAEGRYLFTGDTLIRNESGAWWAGYLPGHSDAAALASSLRLLRTLEPDVVISSAFQGDSAVHRIQRERWAEHVDEALEGLPAGLAKR